MNICGKMSALLTLALFVACAQEEQTVVIPDSLKAVPSDAFAVFSGTCGECLSKLDSSHMFRSIGLESYSKDEAVLAYCHTSVLSPVLVLESVVDSTVLSRALRYGVPAYELVSSSDSGLKGRTVFTISESTMAAVRRHMSMGTSILDASGFVDAASAVVSGDHWAILRNNEMSRLLPKDFLGWCYNRKDILCLLGSVGDWTCFRWNGAGDCELTTVNGDSAAYLSNMMASVKPCESKLPGILPASTEFAVDLPLDARSFRKEYLSYLDANQRLSKYEKPIASLRRDYGIDPVEWENSLGIKEVAFVGWNGKKVVLVRPSVSVSEEAGTNRYPGFPSALYGFLFGLEDDSYCAVMDGWLVTGSENDVRVFIDEERPESFGWPSRPLKFAAYTPDCLVSWTRNNLKLNYGF